MVYMAVAVAFVVGAIGLLVLRRTRWYCDLSEVSRLRRSMEKAFGYRTLPLSREDKRGWSTDSDGTFRPR
jgi:hypothetical protein